MDERVSFEREVERFERRLPLGSARFVRRVRHPDSYWIRMPVAGMFFVGGLFGFLPLLGFWMVPVALLLIAQDLPFLRPMMARFLRWLHSKWPEPSSASSRQ